MTITQSFSRRTEGRVSYISGIFCLVLGSNIMEALLTNWMSVKKCKHKKKNAISTSISNCTFNLTCHSYCIHLFIHIALCSIKHVWPLQAAVKRLAVPWLIKNVCLQQLCQISGLDRLHGMELIRHWETLGEERDAEGEWRREKWRKGKKKKNKNGETSG